jgi:hypothetical protein
VPELRQKKASAAGSFSARQWRNVTEQHSRKAVSGASEDYFLEFLHKNDNMKNHEKVSVLRSTVRANFRFASRWRTRFSDEV